MLSDRSLSERTDDDLCVKMPDNLGSSSRPNDFEIRYVMCLTKSSINCCPAA